VRGSMHLAALCRFVPVNSGVRPHRSVFSNQRLN
jgi:hypothetical protein